MTNTKWKIMSDANTDSLNPNLLCMVPWLVNTYVTCNAILQKVQEC